MTRPSGLSAARQELAAARHLARGGYARAAVSRSYYAASYASEAALLGVGETRARHSGVVAAFNEIVVKTHGAHREAGRLFASLFRRRGEADYSSEPVPPDAAERAIADAQAVVDAVEAWLDQGPPTESVATRDAR